MTGPRLLLSYAAASMRAQMQYRASFTMGLVAQFLLTGIEVVAIWALFARFGNIRGWSLPEVALLYGMAQMSLALAQSAFRGFDVFERVIRRGDFDWLLLRPRPTALQVAGLEIRLRNLGRLAQGLVVLCWAAYTLGIAWTPLRAGLLAAAILGGACLFAGLFVLQGTFTFWTVEALEVFNIFTYGGAEAAQYPLGVYRRWFRNLFTYVLPLSCLNYFPALAILGRPDPLGTPRAVLWTSPLAGVAFLLLALRAWEFGVRRYRSTGS